jgi:hypothetical protein
MNKFKLVLVDPVEEVCSAWREHFEDLPNVKIVNGRFENLRAFDCMVSAANSFGLMDGGSIWPSCDSSDLSSWTACRNGC